MNHNSLKSSSIRNSLSLSNEDNVLQNQNHSGESLTLFNQPLTNLENHIPLKFQKIAGRSKMDPKGILLDHVITKLKSHVHEFANLNRQGIAQQWLRKCIDAHHQASSKQHISNFNPNHIPDLQQLAKNDSFFKVVFPKGFQKSLALAYIVAKGEDAFGEDNKFKTQEFKTWLNTQNNDLSLGIYIPIDKIKDKYLDNIHLEGKDGTKDTVKFGSTSGYKDCTLNFSDINDKFEQGQNIILEKAINSPESKNQPVSKENALMIYRENISKCKSLLQLNKTLTSLSNINKPDDLKQIFINNPVLLSSQLKKCLANSKFTPENIEHAKAIIRSITEITKTAYEEYANESVTEYNHCVKYFVGWGNDQYPIPQFNWPSLNNTLTEKLEILTGFSSNLNKLKTLTQERDGLMVHWLKSKKELTSNLNDASILQNKESYLKEEEAHLNTEINGQVQHLLKSSSGLGIKEEKDKGKSKTLANYYETMTNIHKDQRNNEGNYTIKGLEELSSGLTNFANNIHDEHLATYQRDLSNFFTKTMSQAGDVKKKLLELLKAFAEQIKEYKSQITALKKELTATTVKHKEITTEIKKKEDDIAKTENAIQELETAIQDLSNVFVPPLDFLSQEVSALSSQAIQLEAILQHYQKMILPKYEESFYISLESQLKQYDEQLMALKKSLPAISIEKLDNVTIDNLLTQYSDLQKTISILQKTDNSLNEIANNLEEIDLIKEWTINFNSIAYL
jgi:uncharacterized protein YoxC